MNRAANDEVSVEAVPVETKKEPFVPSEEWRASFEKQATRNILDKLYRIARARLGVYAGGRHKVSDADVDDIVIAALGDTWAGDLTWDPSAKTLFLHLKDAIKFRVRDGAELARKRRRHVEIDEDERGETFAGSIATGAIVPTVETSDPRDHTLGGIADETIAALRPLAERDVEVSTLLDALSKRVIDRDDLLEETGMTIPEYNNAWRRLGRMVRELPAHLRDDALAALA